VVNPLTGGEEQYFMTSLLPATSICTNSEM
jgi:hypothetical protein